MQHRCDCAARGGICRRAPEGAINGREWSICPFGHARNPAFLAVAHLTKALDCGAVEGWPIAFAASIVSGVYALRYERSQWEARELDKQRR